MTAAGDPISKLARRGLDIQYLSHARSILSGEFAPQLQELAGVLADLSVPVTEIIGSGGGETRSAQRVRHALAEPGWRKHNFVIAKMIAAPGCPHMAQVARSDGTCMNGA